jgi:UDP-N-acetylmuramate: L-alanyl-gamma-D-glutamyl-meso-diaminopimelate ligase
MTTLLTTLRLFKPHWLGFGEVIWFKPENMQWDMNTELASKNSLISSNIPDIIESAISTIKQENIKHLVIMSNSGFQGIHNLLVDRLGLDKD